MASEFAQWLSTAEAGRVAGVSRQRIDQLSRSGVLETAVVAGRRLVHRGSLERWRASRPDRQASRLRSLDDLRLKRLEIHALAARHHLANVRVFGSVARGDAGPGSDVDILVDRASAATALDVAEFAADLEDSLGCRVDVVVDSGRGEAMEALRASAVAL